MPALGPCRNRSREGSATGLGDVCTKASRWPQEDRSAWRLSKSISHFHYRALFHSYGYSVEFAIVRLYARGI